MLLLSEAVKRRVRQVIAFIHPDRQQDARARVINTEAVKLLLNQISGSGLS